MLASQGLTAAHVWSAFKASTAACSNCGLGKYSASLGATSEITCLLCPKNTDSSAGSISDSDCLCNAGFTGPNSGTCLECVAGKYKAGIGSAVSAWSIFFDSWSQIKHCMSTVQSRLRDWHLSEWLQSKLWSLYSSTSGTILQSWFCLCSSVGNCL